MHVDSADFKEIFYLYYQNLCYFAFTLIGDREVVEDFVQDAFIGLHKNYHTISKDNKIIKSYLYSSVKNSILNWNRHNNVVKKYHQAEPFNEMLEIDFDNALIRAEVVGEIDNLIGQLPSSCQMVFREYYINGKSLKEIADDLNISINTVKTQKMRGLKFVKAHIRPEYFLVFLFISNNF